MRNQVFLLHFSFPRVAITIYNPVLGLSSSSDEWCCYSYFVIKGFAFAKKIVDDILIRTSNIDELELRISCVLKKCGDIYVTISRKKFTINTEIAFAGFLISDKGIKPELQKTLAISSFPTPKNITDLRSFLGFTNQLAFFLPDFSHLTREMRKLLLVKNAFLWLEFQISKTKKHPIISFFG